MDMLAHQKQESEQALANVTKELEDSNRTVERLMVQESALVQQSAKASVIVTSEEKKRFVTMTLHH